MKKTLGISSMRAALNSVYCMRSVLEVRKKKIDFDNVSKTESFHYQEGQHLNNNKLRHNDVILPPRVKVVQTPQGKRWVTPTMAVELRGDVLEIRDGFGNIIDAVILR